MQYRSLDLAQYIARLAESGMLPFQQRLMDLSLVFRVLRQQATVGLLLIVALQFMKRYLDAQQIHLQLPKIKLHSRDS